MTHSEAARRYLAQAARYRGRLQASLLVCARDEWLRANGAEEPGRAGLSAEVLGALKAAGVVPPEMEWTRDGGLREGRPMRYRADGALL